MADSIGDLVARVLLDSASWDAKMAKLGGDMDDFHAKSDQPLAFADRLQAAGPAILGVGTALSGISAGLGLVGSEAISASEGLTKARIGFTTMLGSGEAANAMLKDLQTFAATTPFEFPDLVASAQRMKALGFEAKDIVPTLRTVGDTAAAMGKGKESIDLMVLALGQMAAKGKVSAQEMNQIAEQGVAGWEMLAKSMGVSIPEAMKLAEKGLIDGKQAQQVILAGMNDQYAGNMDKLSKTLTGQWSNFKDQITAALLPIGDTLAQALSKVMPLLSEVMTWVKDAATWFGQLPQPVQNVALALGAMAAALGPILVAVGGFIVAWGALSTALAAAGTTIGALTATLAPWALGIAAVVAALVLLGSWVYENWDAIVATLSAAWTALRELWAAEWALITGALETVWNAIAALYKPIFDPIIAFFTTIWDAVGPYFVQAWQAIAGALSSVWDSIKGAASSVWSAIVGVFEKFLEWAAKIPGAKALMNLDDTWASAKKASEALDKTAESTKKVGDEAAKAAPKITLAATSNKTANDKAAKAAAKHATAVRDAWDAAHKRIDDRAKEAGKTLKWFEDAYEKLEGLDRKLAKSATDLATDYATAHEKMRKEALKTVEITVPATQRIPPEVQKAIQANKDLEAAYKALGITSAAELAKQYEEAKKTYALIEASGTAVPKAIDKAWVEMETARQAAVVAAGGVIEAEHKKTLDNMKASLDTKTTEQKTKWATFGTEVSTIITNTAQDMAKSFFDGDLSWGEKVKGMFSSLQQAAMSTFITPLTTAFQTLIQGVMKDFLEGDFSLKSMKETVGTVVDGLKDIIGLGEKANDVINKVPDTPSGVPGGGGASGAAGAISGGLSGWITAVSSAVTAISSVIQNFQLAKMETTMNAVEHNTRYSMMYLGERKDGGILGVLFRVQENTQFVQGQLDGLNQKLIDFNSPLASKLDDIVSNTQYQLDKTDTLIARLEDLARITQSVEVSVTATGMTTREAATEMGNAIAKNLAAQMVGSTLR